MHNQNSRFFGNVQNFLFLTSDLRDNPYYGAQLVPPNFYHQVSFSRRQFSLARLFIFATTFYFRHDFMFSARLFVFGTIFFRQDQVGTSCMGAYIVPTLSISVIPSLYLLDSLIPCYSVSLLPCSLATLLTCSFVSLLLCYLVTLLHCYLFVALFPCYFVILLPCWSVTLLPYPSVTLFLCYPVTVLSCSSSTLLLCYLN